MQDMKKRRTLNSVAEVIKAFGGPKAMAGWCGVGTPSISNWKTWGFIPPSWHYRMLMELQCNGYEINPLVFGIDLESTGPYKAKRYA